MDGGIPQGIVIGALSTSVILVVLFPWILAVLLASFAGGYFAIQHFHSYADRVCALIEKYAGVCLLNRGDGRTSLSPHHQLEGPAVPTDPLRHQLFLQEERTGKKTAAAEAEANCNVCSEPKCSRDGEHVHNRGSASPKKQNLLNRAKPASIISSSPSPKKFEPTPYQLPKVDDLKIHPMLDESISKFCSTVFDYYVGSYWAPYETRRQLKLVMKQFLYTVGDRINSRLVKSEHQSPDRFCREKLIPLLLHYFEKITCHRGGHDGAECIFPEEEKQKVRLKIRKLARLVLEESLNEDDLRCKLWIELCIAVLADGVLWNVMSLGRDKLPELLEYYVNVAKIKLVASRESLQDDGDSDSFHDAHSSWEQQGNKAHPSDGHNETDSSNKTTGSSTEKMVQYVPFLLDNFLDRKDSLEQPDPIVSRWRPTLRDIIEETELLYPLIQYLKHVGGQKALAYLQAVLDESPDAKEYCKRILEVEYLPGFCRSHFFHESMGLSKVEQGLEVGADKSPGSSRRKNTHSRSASYGSKTNPVISDFLKMDGGVVEGLPLHFDSDYGSLSANSSSSSAGSAYSSSGNTGNGGATSIQPIGSSGSYSEAESSSSLSMFKRNKASIEDVVSKFYSSTHSLGTGHKKHSSSEHHSLSELNVPRVGIHAKSYNGLNEPDVNKRVGVDPSKCDILERVSDFLTSTITVNPWLGPVISGWLDLLHPYVKPYFELQVEENLKEFLSLDLCVISVDLITDAFLHSGESEEEETDLLISPDHKQKSKSSSSSPTNIPKNDSTKTKNTNSDSSTALHHSHATNPYIRSLSLGNKDQNVKTFLKSLLKICMSHVISLDQFLSSFSTNRDYIFLFFVDVLDLLVKELFNDSETGKQ